MMPNEEGKGGEVERGGNQGGVMKMTTMLWELGIESLPFWESMRKWLAFSMHP